MWSANNSITFMQQDISIILRFIAGILAFGLIIHDMWSKPFTNYLPLYWHLTLMYSLPFLTSFLFLYNNGSYEWLINIALSLFLLAMLVDWISFIALLAVGISLGYILYTKLVGYENIKIIFNNPHKFYLFIYVTFFSTLIGMLFSRNRESIQKSVVDMLEKRVKERTRELEEALLIKKEFLANLNHEIRTPITGIIAYCKALYEHWNDFSEDKKIEILKKLNNAVDRFYTFVSNIFDLSKFETGKIHLNLEKFNLEEIIKEVMEESEIIKLKKNINIALNCNIPFPIIEGDRFKVKQVIRNLLGNAIKYTSEGIISINVKYGKELKDDGSVIKGIIVSISDEGIGIPEEELEVIFDPFSQSTRTKSPASGRGLSLSVSRKIIETHLGKIWAKNNKNKGATFSFILPS
ncbi:MAG: HAMP domain-containing histidine kinase [Sphingobacteriia bacterium]|nr:HAMP domain-containing histidine kinase [Sphingobacteriia bacterium]